MPDRRAALRPALLLALAVVAAGCAPSDTPPNIVLVIGDDHSWTDFGFMGSSVAQTPNLDALARDGVVFTHAFNTASHCRPSLLTLLTGLHPVQIEARLEHLRGEEQEIRLDQEVTHFETLPALLAERGYASFQGGKYWEGTYTDGGFTHGMTTRFGSAGSGRIAGRLAREREMLEPVWTGLWSYAGGAGLALGRETLEPVWNFIDRDAEGPFFIWFAPMLPHDPFDAPARYLDLYAETDLTPMARRFYANVSRFDDVVGKLLAGLEARGLRERTLVIYLSDNGWQLPEPGSPPHLLGGDRGKLSSFELGFRTPLILSWPGELEAGSRRRELVSTVDVVATILDVAGIAPLAEQEGRSLLPLLRGGAAFPRERVFGGVDRVRNDSWRGGATWHREGDRMRLAASTDERVWFARDPVWRYVWYQDRDRESLYRIEEDPFEQRDLAAAHPDVAARLRRELEEWIEAMRAPSRAL